MFTSWSDAVVPLLAVGSGAALLYALLAPDERQRAIRSLPCPASTLPVLGNTLDLMFYQLPRLHDWISEQCLLHGGKTWRLQALSAPPLVVVSSVACFEDVLKTQFEVFDKGPRMNKILSTIAGESIAAVDGDQWKQQRRAMSHLFTMRKFRETICVSIEKHLRGFGNVLDQVVQHQEQGSEQLFDIGEAFHRYAFDTFTEIAFGLEEETLPCMIRASSQDKDHQDVDQTSGFLQASVDAAALIELRFHQPDWLWQLKRKLNIGSERRLAEAVQIIDERVYDVVHKTLERNRLGSEGHTKNDVVSIMMDHAHELKNHSEDPNKLAKYLRDSSFTTIFAGKDTTGTSLTWFLIMMAKEPRVLNKIRDELLTELPELFHDKCFVPSMDTVEHGLVYLEAAIRETLRLCALLPLNAKEANRDVTLCDGTFMKKGTRVYIPSYALARMPSVWGKDAAQFNPERWIDQQTGKLKSFSSFQFVAFHAGPRICLGMRFALVELKTTLAYLLPKYDFELERPGQTYQYEMALSLAVKGPVRARVTRRHQHHQ